jgi:hypothetical protein
MKIRIYSFISIIILSAGFILGSSVLAARAQVQDQNVPGQSLAIQGLAIDPFLIETDVVSGQSSEYSITLTNTTDTALTFETSINDFTTNGKDGQPLFLNSSEQSDPKYSLSTWIKITQQPNFTIPPRGQTTVHFTITPPADAESGTHYGGLLFGQPKQQLAEQGAAVQSKVGTIILARLGKANEQGSISEFFSQHKIYQAPPIGLVLTYHNYGNVHSKPKGDVYIRNMFGREVKDIQVNRDANIVLPENERDFNITWSPSWAFGRYTAESVLYFGNPKLEVRAKTSFWVLPILPLLAGLCILIVLIAAIYVIIMRYNRYIIKRAQK